MNTSFADTQLQQVLHKFRAGEFDAAAALVDAILVNSPGHSECLNLGAAIALRRRRFDLAEGYAHRALAGQPENTTFKFTLAQVYSALQRYPDALAELRSILRVDPSFHRAHRHIWNIMKICGRQAEATGLIKQRLAAFAPQRAAGLPKTRIKIPETTLCCIDCKNHELAIRALNLSLAGCEFARTIFLTDREFDCKPVETITIEPIRTLQDYSNFVMKGLLPYIDTEYVLLVQWDGYVVNPAVWSDQFLLFDYVGARWPVSFGVPAEFAVGNGGFSLRSRTLLEALQDPRIVFPPAGKYSLETHSEDFAICLNHRRYLEREHGISFAPAEVADRFSFEHVDPTGPTFGFHGQVNITRFVDDMAIRMIEAR